MMKKLFGYKRILIAILLLFVLTVALSGKVIGKFVLSRGDSEVAEPQDFYFRCSYENGGIYYLAGSTVTVSVSNFDGLGNTNASEIECNVTCVKIDSKGVEIGVPATTSLTLSGGAEDSASVWIPSVDADKGDRYRVTVQTVSPYQKTISFTLIFMEEDAKTFYNLTRYGSWLQLDLYIGSSVPAGGITVDYEGLSPDSTNAMMQDWLTADNSHTIPAASLSDHAHYTLIFFGTDLGSSSSEDLSIVNDTIDISVVP